ncbi:glycosyltransferase [Nostoc linckia z18]|uniref:Glycosyltransferase n=2 Tax=Nostoc linckia TaxID=92942 RepID=A0A9Q5ZH40_NOSLI|nr:glycosyltransferase family 4 protein [Nostoc linckia]PHK35382.1 glycosyltransferase [Nostoc linckia z15]PHK45963.1 glycosyltransferase [Nostoc linckia z16]PHJ67999.1 glycosyltransferase [Nostoc linckia z1]PHJ72937.1 glycosyltransferase [Nostoc linckia z3]PHJ77407.1 glycosyltransferase [Nostoc linckia z2]
MRIIHILNHIQEIGNGIVNVAVDLACLQSKSGHEVAVISSGGEYEILLKKYGVKHYELDQTRKPINMIKAAIGYRAIATKFQPDIVHAHMMTGVLLARIFQNRYALVSTVHNEFQRASLLMGLADRVIAVSQAVRDSMARRGIPENKLRVVCNGTLGSPRTQQIGDYQTLALQRPAIATVAGMYQRKGIAELIAAFEQIASDFPQVHLYLVGNGPDKQLFETQAQGTSVSERIHFEGFQPEPQRYLKSCDIFVLASHRDPCPLVLSEAREAGTAIVGTQVDGIPEALDNGQAGLLVPAKDSRALAGVLVQLLSDSNMLQEWKQRANQNLERLSVARVHQETLAVYGEVTYSPL